MQYKVQFVACYPDDREWSDLKDNGTTMFFHDMDEAVFRAARQAREFHSYKYRVVGFSEPEVIMTLQGGTSESI